MTDPYKTEYSGTYFVAVKVNQDPPDQINAPDHDTFNDESGNPLHFKCSKCDDYFSIGHGKRNPPNKTFEMLSGQLEQFLMSDHSNYRLHALTIPLS